MPDPAVTGPGLGQEFEDRRAGGVGVGVRQRPPDPHRHRVRTQPSAFGQQFRGAGQGNGHHRHTVGDGQVDRAPAERAHAARSSGAFGKDDDRVSGAQHGTGGGLEIGVTATVAAYGKGGGQDRTHQAAHPVPEPVVGGCRHPGSTGDAERGEEHRRVRVRGVVGHHHTTALRQLPLDHETTGEEEDGPPEPPTQPRRHQKSERGPRSPPGGLRFAADERLGPRIAFGPRIAPRPRIPLGPRIALRIASHHE